MDTSVPERIIPDETMRVDYIDHLARYEYIKPHVVNKVLLDCGCGNGYGSYELAAFAQTVCAIDVSGEAVEYAKRHYSRANLNFNRMDSLDLQFSNAFFDVVCSFDVIEHVRDPYKFLQEISRVLRVGGQAFLSTPNRLVSSNGLDHPLNPFHLKEFDQAEFSAMARDYFRQVEVVGEFEDQALRDLKSQTTKLRTIWHSLDRFHLREYIPSKLRQGVLSAFVKISTGKSLVAVSERNIVFSDKELHRAPTLFMKAEK